MVVTELGTRLLSLKHCLFIVDEFKADVITHNNVGNDYIHAASSARSNGYDVTVWRSKSPRTIF